MCVSSTERSCTQRSGAKRCMPQLVVPTVRRALARRRLREAAIDERLVGLYDSPLEKTGRYTHCRTRVDRRAPPPGRPVVPPRGPRGSAQRI